MNKASKSKYKSKKPMIYAKKSSYNVESIEHVNQMIGEALKSSEYSQNPNDAHKLIEQAMNLNIASTDQESKYDYPSKGNARGKYISKRRKQEQKYEPDEFKPGGDTIADLYNKIENKDPVPDAYRFNSGPAMKKEFTSEKIDEEIISEKDSRSHSFIQESNKELNNTLQREKSIKIQEPNIDLNNTIYEEQDEDTKNFLKKPSNQTFTKDPSSQKPDPLNDSKNLFPPTLPNPNPSLDPDPSKPEEKQSNRHEGKNKKPGKNQIFYIETLFWRKTTTWKQRKLIAESLLEASISSDSDQIHHLAYEGKKSDLVLLLQSSPQSNPKPSFLNPTDQTPKISPQPEIELNNSINYNLLQKNSLGLSPLIYAIWGEVNREEESKDTSSFIFKLYQDRYEGKPAGTKKSKYVPYDLELKQELGHAIVHGLVKDIGVYHLVAEDFDDSVSFVLEALGFHLSPEVFEHPACRQEKVSVVSFAIRVKAMQCIHLLFTKIIENTGRAEFIEMLEVIEGELGEYLGFNSPLLEELLAGFTNLQSKSLPVNMDKLPVCVMVDSEASRIEELAYVLFDDMIGATNFIKSMILNSKIRLPSLLGSHKSLQFMQRLADSENTSLYRIDLIKTYIIYKWDSIWWFIFLQSILMWFNIPLIVLLVFVHPYNKSLLVIFTLINLILTLFEIFQFSTLTLFQYLGNVDQRHLCAGLRFIMLVLIFFPNFQPFNCIIYIFLTACIWDDEGASKVKIFKTCFVYLVYSALVFVPFWLYWDDVRYLVVAYWPLVFVAVWVFRNREEIKQLGIFARFLELAMAVVVICSRGGDVGVLVFTAFVIGLVTLLGLCQFLQDWKKIYFFADLVKLGIFCLNFGDGDEGYFFGVNSAVIVACVVMIVVQRIFFDKEAELTSFGVQVISLSILNMIGFDVKDEYSIKFCALFLEFLLLNARVHSNEVSLIQIPRNLLNFLINWNSIDLGRIILCILFLIYEFQSSSNQEVTYCLISLILIRGLTGFRCFRMTRYYVRLILNSIRDILPFILIFFYSTLSFGIICSVYRDISMSELWMYPYDLNIGAASHNNEFDINYISFFIATVINVIIMLNLLISILGDSFDRFQINALEIDFMEMAKTLVEFETMMVWRRKSLDTGKFLVGIMNENQQKKKQGKITRSEFFELRDVVYAMRDNMDKQFSEGENRVLEYVDTRIEESENYVLEIIEEKILDSEKRILIALEKIISRVRT